MNEKNLESVRRCSSLLCVRAVCVVRTAWCGVVRTIIIWKRWCQLWRARMIRRWAGRGKRDYLPGRGAARVPPENVDARFPFAVVNSFLHGRRVPIIDFPPRAHAPPKAASRGGESALGDGAALIFPGVFARTSLIIDRRPKRAAPPSVSDRCLFWRRVRLGYVVAGLYFTRACSPPSRLTHVGGTAVAPDTRPLVPLDPIPVYIFISFSLVRFFFHTLPPPVTAAKLTHAHVRPARGASHCFFFLFVHVHVSARAFHRECVCVGRFLISLSGGTLRRRRPSLFTRPPPYSVVVVV